MNLDISHYLNLVLFGNLLIKGETPILPHSQDEFLKQNLKFVCNENGIVKRIESCEEWFDYCIRVKKINSFRLFYLDKKIIVDAEKKFYNQKFFDKTDFFNVYIECKYDNHSDFFSQILFSLKQEKPLIPVFENINCEYTIIESLEELIENALNQLELIIKFVKRKNVYYLISYYENIKVTLSESNELFSFILNNEFTFIENRIINTKLSLVTVGSIISHNESILSNDEEKDLYEMDKVFIIYLNKSLLKVVNKEYKKVL